MNKYKTTRTHCRGFTLIEILVAVIILAVGILAVAHMTIISLRSTTVMNNMMYARTLLTRYYETFMGLPVNDSLLLHLTSASLSDTTMNRDYEQIETTAGGLFRVMWNVGDSVPDFRFKTVRIHILYPRARQHLWSDVIKRYREEL